MTEYDDTILQEYANDLYRQAKGIVFWTALRYGVAVFLASVAIGILLISLQKKVSAEAINSAGILVTVVGVAVGIDAGRRKAFTLKLHAQQMLCLRQTELNTRKLT